MIEATIRAQVELQYALDRMSTPLHASRLSGATAAEDARCMAIIRAEIDRLTRERDAMAKDAERYRWMRDRELPEWMDLYHQHPARVDAAIDAQIEQEKANGSR